MEQNHLCYDTLTLLEHALTRADAASPLPVTCVGVNIIFAAGPNVDATRVFLDEFHNFVDI
jgi:hypothetical protein